MSSTAIPSQCFTLLERNPVVHHLTQQPDGLHSSRRTSAIIEVTRCTRRDERTPRCPDSHGTSTPDGRDRVEIPDMSAALLRKYEFGEFRRTSPNGVALVSLS